MKNQVHTTTAYQAVARIAYKTNEVFPIYPCTPTSEMSALTEEWSAQGQPNAFGKTPVTYEMQSEAGVAGTMHGALQTGALASTFTASQGLLLMIPNMYKIAGQLFPNVIHVATRSIATHALSVYGDHSDIMAARQTGYAFLGSASVQEAQDFALIAQAATLKSRIPFVHFMDGFRTSHETNTIKQLSDETIDSMIDRKALAEHKERALDPSRPVLRGTTQGPDVFFQSREAQNLFYKICPAIVQDEMNRFAEFTGRQYHLFDYVGHPEAEQLIISMASSCETIEQTIITLNERGSKYGLIKVRLFRPFSTKYLLQAIPKTVQKIAVLDRTKEPGATGEPLYLDVVQAISQAYQNQEIQHLPYIVGGRYGLSSKEFTPTMVAAIFDNLHRSQPKNSFTVGINDDVTRLSLKPSNDLHLNDSDLSVLFYQKKSKQHSEKFNQFLNDLAETKFVQGYTACDYKKSNARSVAQLRVSTRPIKAPYQIEVADLAYCEDGHFIEQDTAVARLKQGGTLLVTSSDTPLDFWNALSPEVQEEIRSKQIDLKLLDERSVIRSSKDSTNNLSARFAALWSIIDYDNVSDNEDANNYVVRQVCTLRAKGGSTPIDLVFTDTLLGKMLSNRGNEVSVRALPVDGTYPTNTAQFNRPIHTDYFPDWNADSCTQCGACSMACPQGAIRMKVYDDAHRAKLPADFNTTKALDENFDLLNFTLQVNPDQCTACNNCMDACSEDGALTMVSSDRELTRAREHQRLFNQLPEVDRAEIDSTKVGQQQLQEPLFKASIGVDGCGEAPYLKVLSQLFGDRLLVANATGASSIFGGALPTTPWSKNKAGHGPAWANSLFEDNAEFGLGFKLSLDYKQSKDRSVWIVGGDGWAYDIGYGGLDHVLASGKNVNILVLDNEVYDNTGGQMSKATPMGAQAKFSFLGKGKQKKDLGFLAMQYEGVYVASVAMGADQEQTLKAFNEAESFDGPSLIIAYCHSESHGIDMRNPRQYHKAAVASGQWLLFRNDPRRIVQGLPALQLDSDWPSIPIEAYMKLEKRFSKVFENTDLASKDFIRLIQERVDDRFRKYFERSLVQKDLNALDYATY